MRLATRHHWDSYRNALRLAAVLGGAFGMLAGAAVLKPPLIGAAMGACSGVVDGLTLMLLIGGVEIFLPRSAPGRWLAQRPFLAAVAFKSILYTGVIVAVVGLRLGPRVALLALDPETALSLRAQTEASLPRGLLAAVAAQTVLLLILLRQATQIVGEHTARAIAFGRYHRPHAEERFFLFIDVVGSTPVAERLGALQMHRYLSRIFQLASDPVDDHGGEVYQYVGDEIVVTWTMAQGRAGAKPLACLLAIEAALAAAAPEFEREFGSVPKLRAALHAGEVVTGETGGSRRAIVFHGDVMNATSRIENLTRSLGHAFLVSEDARSRMDGTAAYAFIDLGPQELRGKQAVVRVYAVQMPEVRAGAGRE